MTTAVSRKVRTDVAGIYVRLSKDVEGQSCTERQEADGRALAARLGIPVVEVFVDLGRSGYARGAKRPGFEAALDALVSGRITTLIVWRLDRLTGWESARSARCWTGWKAPAGASCR